MHNRPEHHTAASTAKGYDYGVALMRVVMCFVVVLIHCSSLTRNDVGDKTLFSMLSPLAVHCFMLAAFYYSARLFGELRPLRPRLWRLLMPHIGWTVLYTLTFANHVTRGEWTLPHLLKLGALQLAMGHTLNETMWFHFALVVITVLFWWMHAAIRDPRRRTVALVAVGAAGLAMQYSGLNSLLFTPLPGWASHPLGRICEMLPYASAGVLLARGEVTLTALRRRWRTLACCVAVATLMWVLQLRGILSGDGFGYGGAEYCVGGVTLFVLALNLRLPSWSHATVRFLSTYTMGIYCMHRMADRALLMITHESDHSVARCVLIWAMCLTTCWLLGRMPWRWARSLAV